MNLIQSYEQQYSTVTADITHNIGKIATSQGVEKQNYVKQAEKLFEEANELLEQMDLEVKELEAKDRQKYHTRVKSFKIQLTKLQADLKRAKLGIDANRDELLGDDTHDSEDQRARLLDNSETLERTSRRLDHGYRIAIETEQMGSQILDDLHSQRQTITRSRGRLQEMDSALGKSSRLLSGMMHRVIQNRVMLLGVMLIVLIAIILFIYFMVKSHS
ncbi:vesicle transport through interaction with t-SNAREs homolog 1A-like [Physella acuta]|uniref:vesicle transport through interaction with t-SNAREs homolog 1A-like n=1 Tax=Physella acuta TaxID=109671 RepID=UPI0027DBC033|nr:vesicle transport through interaction with t-SNAREs homolog 1A-like [Physella acuta]